MSESKNPVGPSIPSAAPADHGNHFATASRNMKAGDWTVAQVLDWFVAHDTATLSDKARIERVRVRSLFKKQYGERLVSECRPADLLEFIVGLKGCKSGWTKRRVKAIVCRPFNVASKMGLIHKNPFAGLSFPEGARGRDWTKDELQTVLRNSTPAFRRIVIFIRFSGCRPGEAINLKWSQIMDAAQVIVQETHKQSHRTHAPRRIYFNSVVAKLLACMKRERLKVKDLKFYGGINRLAKGHVFLNSYGKQWTTKSLTKNLETIRDKLNLPASLKLHGCRHTFATTAIMNAVPIATLAELLGHDSVATTARYIHLVNHKSHLNAAANQAIGRNANGEAPPAPSQAS